MEVNKEQSEKCRDLGAASLRQGDYEKAVKMLEKSLQLHPLPGVEALLAHAKLKKNEPNQQQQQQSRSSSSANSSRSTSSTTNGTSNHPSTTRRTSSSTTTSETQQKPSNSGSDGRSYTSEQVSIVKKVLQAKKDGGRTAHYKVLDIATTATESDIKKAYRKISLKVHPDKNAAPHADEAFKAVGLAYATLSDTQKRTIYDRYGDEDPDNRGGSSGGMASHMRHGGGQEMSPEDIFNAFFGGGMPGGMGGGGGMPGGVHFYSSSFGPGGGIHFRSGGNARQRQQQQQAQNEQQAGFGMLLQMLPVLLFIALSFLSSSQNDQNASVSKGEGQYFSLVSKPPFTNPMATRLTKVKEIPFFVSDKFVRIFNRDRYQLAQVEHLVERAYENYLHRECKAQKDYKKRLLTKSQKKEYTDEERQKLVKLANEYELSRCEELRDLFPSKQNQRK